VRAAVASGPGVSEELLLRLAHDKDDLIRLRVACNSKATRNVLAALVGDACPGVSAHAQARLTHDISGVSLPASYLDDLRELDWLHSSPPVASLLPPRGATLRSGRPGPRAWLDGAARRARASLATFRRKNRRPVPMEAEWANPVGLCRSAPPDRWGPGFR
jgi:hypothetical protein